MKHSDKMLLRKKKKPFDTILILECEFILNSIPKTN